MSDALDAVERIADREERVRAKSQVMATQAARNKDWSHERDELIRELWNNGGGLSYQEIADRLEIKKSTVQSVFRGKGSGTTRPRVARERTVPERVTERRGGAADEPTN